MNILDIVLGFLLAYGLYKGLKNGLFVEITSIGALIAGLYGAIHFSYIAGDYLSNSMEWNERYINITSFIITFIIIVVVIHMAGRLLTEVADLAMLGLVNKIAGGIFGSLKVAIILGALLIFFDKANASLGMVQKETASESLLYEPIKEIGALVFGAVFRSNKMREQEADQEPVPGSV